MTLVITAVDPAADGPCGEGEQPLIAATIAAVAARVRGASRNGTRRP